MSIPVSLSPLDESHAVALQRVYELTPAYWRMYHLAQVPEGQAARDLAAVAETPGRAAMGILTPNQPGNPQAGAQLIGLMDFRLHWPDPQTVYLGVILVAEPFQRRGVATQAWRLLEPWLAGEAGMALAKLGVEQFNPGALAFFQTLGFQLTGEAPRIRSGKRFVRLLAMEKRLIPNDTPEE